MKHLRLLASAALACAIAAPPPISAKDADWDFTTRIVKDSKKVVLDPAKAHLLVQTPSGVVSTFYRVPTEAEREKDRALRAQALAEERKDWTKKMARYERDMERYKSGSGRRKPEKPEEPTEENFPWRALETEFMVTVGPLNRFAKEDGNSLYLHEVPPGEYVFYGSILMGMGVCACMGTVKFEVEQGKITTLRSDGVFLDKDGNPLDRMNRPEGQDTNDVLVRYAMIVEPADSRARDPRLPPERLTSAQFTPVEFVPNWFGAQINRLLPMEGVFAYERDKQIDLKAKAAEEEATRIAALREAETQIVAQEAAGE